MASELAFANLLQDIVALQDAVSAIQVTVIEDKPIYGGTVLVDQLGDLVTDLTGMLEQAVACAAEAHRSVKVSQLDLTRQALTRLNQLFNRFAGRYAYELAAYDQVATLLGMGRERGQEWCQWSLEVKRGIVGGVPQVKIAADALASAWTELALILPWYLADDRVSATKSKNFSDIVGSPA